MPPNPENPRKPRGKPHPSLQGRNWPDWMAEEKGFELLGIFRSTVFKSINLRPLQPSIRASRAESSKGLDVLQAFLVWLERLRDPHAPILS